MTLQPGQSAEIQKVFGPAEVAAFAELSEDRNPIHLDAEFAAQTPFGHPIVHGILLSSLLSGLLGQHLPGQGTIYLGQTLKFVRPVLVGEAVTARVTVAQVRDDKPIVTLTTEVVNAKGEPCVQGEAVVKV
ncbi:MaoC domain protein dehydratase [Ferrimonas balearica DSM 9799]|uniref:MaoC domain protein dehydratase n=1 Tax=Ferrimonas balearica (strain DSM 9799 / CCM 4581 / KCTC 23876 / PAT) TaxID=550540 RepID=E1SNA1_FERBD|nr:MaoC family dehydratase [Ferrimonas balearica]ADN74600.1 MaoC domain protein dehydratase [Ferrimonas balearica DSM 9799]MBW3140413.1 MaoC family dehydratase [Ferrimonas balearica]MBW3165594.1 MaoC family dehydratase [Ferrimonas balearica]MBY5981182.1 MaoC family dehydratase [Ferrimonas balearica]MBY6107772.1 MaoC family dehydratase [Ferrimonas balearica]